MVLIAPFDQLKTTVWLCNIHFLCCLQVHLQWVSKGFAIPQQLNRAYISGTFIYCEVLEHFHGIFLERIYVGYSTCRWIHQVRCWLQRKPLQSYRYRWIEVFSLTHLPRTPHNAIERIAAKLTSRPHAIFTHGLRLKVNHFTHPPLWWLRPVIVYWFIDCGSN